VFFGAALVYGAIAMAVTGTGLRDISVSWPKGNDALEIGVTLFAIVNLVQFVLLSRTMANSVRRRMRSDLATIAFLDLLTPWIIRWAILDALPVWGGLLVLLRHDVGKFLPFFVVTIVGLALSFPSQKKLEDLFRKCGIRSIARRSEVPSTPD
jgi:hypothetical protein